MQEEVGHARQRFDAVVASVNEIAHENVAFVRNLATNIEQLQHKLKVVQYAKPLSQIAHGSTCNKSWNWP